MKIHNLLLLFLIVSLTSANVVHEKPQVLNSTTALINWTPPGHDFTSFKLELKQFKNSINNFVLSETFDITYNVNSYEIKNLIPGGLYSIQLFTLKNDEVISNCLTQQVVIKPNPPMDLIVTNITTKSASIFYTPPASGVFHHYRIIINPPDNKNKSVFYFSQTNMTFDNLYEGTTYSVTVQTVTIRSAASNKMIIQFKTLSTSPVIRKIDVPIVCAKGSPFNIKFNKSSNSTSFIMSWEPLNLEYDFDHYELVIFKLGFWQRSVINKRVVWWEVRGLNLDVKYYFIFKTINRGIQTLFVDGFVTLFSISALEPPSHLEVQLLDSTTAQAKWNVPNQQEKYSGYQLTLDKYDNCIYKHIKTLQVSRDTNTFIFNDLIPGETYCLKISTLGASEMISAEYISRLFMTTSRSSENIITSYTSERTIAIIISPVISSGKNYWINLYPADEKNQSSFVSTSNKIRFDDLLPGRAYNISVKIYTDNNDNSILYKSTFQTIPLAPQNIKFFINSMTGLASIQWDHPSSSCDFDYYQINLNSRVVIIDKKINFYSWKIDEDYNSFYFDIQTVSGQLKSQSVMKNIYLKNNQFLIKTGEYYFTRKIFKNSTKLVEKKTINYN
ncbi:hypothetical protein HCN44_003645 [Aphidius gifuensis]|uniref:Fibronectin type-III domain-containing protein n=1 Tax=Aphidius gifuensis TaxID=684658 RepID=A0A835CL10_APHGI|nr:hypothetical protein HCN44_003645 [Aphidius gifuensis]